MRLVETLAELLIYARESGGDERPDLRIVCSTAERQLEALQNKRLHRRRRGQENVCLRCEQRRTSGMLCLICLEEAPAPVRDAFQLSSGLDGMRAANALVRAWARNDFAERSAA